MRTRSILYPILALVVVLAVFYALKPRVRKEPGHPASGIKVSLRIPDTRFMGILPLYVAEEKGCFKQAAISVKWLDVKDPGQASKLFFPGQADVVMTTFANLIPAEVRKPGTMKLLFPIYESAAAPGSFILVRPDSRIRTVRDLRGKTLGTYSGPSQKTYAFMVLRKLGFREPDDVRLVQVATSAQVQGLFGGSYDALFTVGGCARVS